MVQIIFLFVKRLNNLLKKQLKFKIMLIINNNIIRGAIIIFYKNINRQRFYLAVYNPKTGNTSFVGGAEEDIDNGDLYKTAKREVKEEIGINPDEYILKPTTLINEFFFGEHKIDRLGCNGKYNVFYADISDINEIIHQEEQKSIQ